MVSCRCRCCYRVPVINFFSHHQPATNKARPVPVVRVVLRFGLAMARASMDQKLFYHYGFEASSLWMSLQIFHQPTNQSNFPHWVSTPFFPYHRSKCTVRATPATPAHMVQATPASRCEPTFRSSGTPALLVPKQLPCCVTVCVGPSSVMVRDCVQNVHTNNHQSPITNHQSDQ